MSGAVSALQARDLIRFTADYPPGSIVVVNAERALYYVLGNGQALRYPVAVGTPEEIWPGDSVLTRKRKHPGWGPTRSQRKADPSLPRYVPPGPDNPLGSCALYLGWGVYRIHGTNLPNSIGTAVSSGCIRMLNQDVIDLYRRVPLGSKVVVVGPALAPESVRQAYRSERAQRLEGSSQSRRRKKRRSFRDDFFSIFSSIGENR